MATDTTPRHIVRTWTPGLITISDITDAYTEAQVTAYARQRRAEPGVERVTVSQRNATPCPTNAPYCSDYHLILDLR